MNKLQTTNNEVIDQLPDDLSAEEIKFSHLVARGMSLTTAYRNAFPLKKDLSYGYIRQLASDLLTKTNILTEVSTHQTKTAHLARLAEDRIEQILVEDESDVKGSKVADVAMFMYDHANGKAITKIQAQSKHVIVTYNLGGDDAGEVPQHILDELADD